METRIVEIAERIKELREIVGISIEGMATALELSPEQYRNYEKGQEDFSFTFLLKCAELLGVDVAELVTGEPPKLTFYSVARKGKEQPIKHRKGTAYQHLAYLFKNKMAEPFLVKTPYLEEEQNGAIEMARHEGQEFNYVLKGSLKVVIENHVEILHEGDAIYYDSSHSHGLTAAGGNSCEFLAIIIKKNPL